jgi:hypothetical protein
MLSKEVTKGGHCNPYLPTIYGLKLYKSLTKSVTKLWRPVKAHFFRSLWPNAVLGDAKKNRKTDCKAGCKMQTARFLEGMVSDKIVKIFFLILATLNTMRQISMQMQTVQTTDPYITNCLYSHFIEYYNQIVDFFRQRNKNLIFTNVNNWISKYSTSLSISLYNLSNGSSKMQTAPILKSLTVSNHGELSSDLPVKYAIYR